MILPLETRHTDFDFLVTTIVARAVDGTRIPSESAIVRAVLAPNVTNNLFEVLVGTLADVAGTVVLVVLVAEVSIAGHSLDVGTFPLRGFPGQPVLPCT